MTMPHLMNCGHSDTGWCLDCVREQWDELQHTSDALASLAYTAERCADLIVSVSDRYDLDVAVESAKDFLAGRPAGGGVGRTASAAEATDNAEVSDRRAHGNKNTTGANRRSLHG